MAWFSNWFSKKNIGSDGFGSDSELFDRIPTEKSAAHGHRKTPGGPNHHKHAESKTSDRKSMRLEQRELLYAVVREVMARLGVISPNYKYKVLSLDPQGRQYLVMMDMKHDLQSQSQLMSQIERLLAQEAKARHDILVTGIYWRFNEGKALAEAEAPPPSPLKPSLADPVDARTALENSLNKPRDHRAGAPTAFQDTLPLDPDELESPLSGTQLGTFK